MRRTATRLLAAVLALAGAHPAWALAEEVPGDSVDTQEAAPDLQVAPPVVEDLPPPEALRPLPSAVVPLSGAVAEPLNWLSLSWLFVDNPNGKFGEYNGLVEDEHNAVLGFNALLREPDAPERYWMLRADNLGLDSYGVSAAHGAQGRYELRAGWEQLQKVWHGDALTIYDDALEVLESPREITTKTRRETGSAGFDLRFGPDWKLSTDYAQEDKQGQRASPVNGGLVVPQDIDFEHRQFTASLAHANEWTQFSLGAYASDFRNANDLYLGTSEAPNNDFHQFRLNGGVDTPAIGRFSAYAAFGEGSQDDPFTRYGIDAGTYEADSLRGKYDELNLRLGWRHRLSRQWDLEAGYWLDDRDSKTPLWSGFPDDKNNRVYDWKKERLFVEAGWRLPGRWRLLGGLEQRDRGYTQRQVPRTTGRLPEQAARLHDSTDETAVWAELRTPIFDGGFGSLFGSLKWQHADRDSDLDPVHAEATQDTSGGLALSSYMFPRDRDRVDLALTWSIDAHWSLGLLYSTIRDDYEPISWASLERQDLSNLTLDLGLALDDGTTLGVYLGQDTFESFQTGWATRGDPDTRFAYDVEDESRFAGFNLVAPNWLPRTVLRFDARYYDGEGDNFTQDANPDNVSGAFPTIETTIHTLSLRADIRLNEDWALDLAWLYEDYDSSTWAWRRDYGEEGGWFSVLNYGYDSPVYDTHVLMVSGRYTF